MARRQFIPVANINAQQIARFHANYIPEPISGCWLWVDYAGQNGYAVLSISGNVYASRVSYFLHYGVDPESLCVLHKCDTPMCVNPHHLFLGDRTENMADKMRKGRHVKPTDYAPMRRGSDHGMAKLRDDQVLEIRRLHATGRFQYKDLGLMFGVSGGLISLIVRRKNWTHII